MQKFNECDEIGNMARVIFIEMLLKVERPCGIHYKEPKHDIARRFLNEIQEFKALEEVNK